MIKKNPVRDGLYVVLYIGFSRNAGNYKMIKKNTVRDDLYVALYKGDSRNAGN